MLAAKRFRVRVTVPGSELLCQAEFTDEHHSTTTLDALMCVWDPFYDHDKSTLQRTSQALANLA